MALARSFLVLASLLAGCAIAGVSIAGSMSDGVSEFGEAVPPRKLAMQDADVLPVPPPPTRSKHAGAKRFVATLPDKSGTLAFAQAAGDWLLTQQQPGGDFPWTPYQTTTYRNTQGATALSLLRLYGHSADPAHLAGAVANGDCQVAGDACITGLQFSSGKHRFSTHDAYFLQALSTVSGDPQYGQLAAADFWAELAASTYGGADYPGSSGGDGVDAAEFADLVVAARSSIPEYVAWDLSKTLVAAHDAGEAVAEAALLLRIEASLDAAVGRSSGPAYNYDIIGLAGGLWAAASTGHQLNPGAGLWMSASNNVDMANLLTGYQTPGGGFSADSNSPIIDDSLADSQTTAWAILALHAVDPYAYRTEIQAALDFLEALQQSSGPETGQVLAYVGAPITEAGGVEGHGEALEAYAIAGLATDRYVAKTGNDAIANDCSFMADPCLTIQKALDEADTGNTIHIDSGTYDQPLSTSKNALTLLGEGVTQPVLTVGSGATNQSVLSLIGAEGISIDNLGFRVDVSFAGEGVLCRDGCTGLAISNSNFVQLQSSATRSSYGRTNAISAGVVGSHPVPVEINVGGTTIAGDPGSPFPTQFRAGVALDYGFGQIGGPDAGDRNDIVSVNHDVIVRQQQGGDLQIQGNTFRGFGVQYTTPLVTAGAVNIAGNLFQPLVAPDSPAPAGDFSAMRLISNPNGILVTVFDNTFIGHERGVLVENFSNVTLQRNLFMPKPGSNTFSHLVVSNKELFSGVPPLPLSQSLGIFAIENFFQGGFSPAEAGVAVEFLNDNAQGEPLGGYYGAAVFGAPGLENHFAGEFDFYIKLNEYTCSNSNLAPCPLAALYENAIGSGAGTPVVPYAGNIDARYNDLDGFYTATMPDFVKVKVLVRTQDDRSNPALGHVDYGFTGGRDFVYVDDDFAGGDYGDSHVFVHGDPWANGRTVYFGIDAFATIPDALMAVADGGEVYIAKGSYPAAVSLAKHADLIGDGSADTDPMNSSFIGAGITVSASGADAMDRLRIKDLRIQNPSAQGLIFSGAAGYDHIEIDGVNASGNARSGLRVNGTSSSNDWVVANSRFDNNGNPTATPLVAGFMFVANASIDGLDISNSTFNDNNGGGLAFNDIGGGGTAVVQNISIAGSEFSRNNPASALAGGGGLWLKTGFGGGGGIDGVTITNSTFADNGSDAIYNGQEMNRVGIHVRARAGTYLRNVVICDNSFINTTPDLPGMGGNPIQEVGIYVFDQTGVTGYEPIEVCANNVFTDQEHSVSGYEQYTVDGTEPPVIFSGGQVENWEHLAFPDVAVAYVDDDYAGSINGASVAFAGNPAAACGATSATFAINAFASIGDALDHLQAGGTVCVAAGSYVEGDVGAGTNLVIDQSAHLFGAQAGVDARGRADAGASVIVPAVPNPALSYSGPEAQAVIDIQVGDVTLDGFVIDGDNPGIATGLPMGAADPDVDSGIWAFGDNVVVVNNVIRNLVYAGFEGYTYAAAHPARQGNVVQRNWIHNIDAPSSWGLGVVLLWNHYADVSENLIEGVRVGIQTNYFFKTAPVPAEARIADNSIAASRLGIYHNYHTADYSQSSPFTISGNMINANANPAGSGAWGGLFVQALYNASTATISDNAINGSALAGSGRLRVGYFAGLIESSEASNTAIDGGSVSGVDFGVLATDGAFFAGRVDDIVVRDVAFSDVAVAALGVEDTDLAGAESVNNAVRLTVGSGNSFAVDVVQHGSLSGPNGQIEFDAGAPLLEKMLVRAAGNGHRGALPDSNGNVRTVSPGIVDDAIDDAAVGGVVTMEAGDFAQTVTIDKSLTLQGPFAGTPGHDAGRDGSGEAVLNPAAGRALRVLADDVTVDGISIDDVNDTAISSGQNYGGSSANVLIVNNRVTNVHDGSGLYTNGPAPAVADWTVQDNLFRNIESPIGSGINLWKVDAGLITGNVVEQSAFGGIQINTANDVEISANTISDTAHNGINVAVSSNVQVFGNSVSDANTSGTPEEAGLTLYGDSSDVSFFCNRVDGSGINAFSTNSAIAAPLAGITLFHNALQVPSSISHNLDVGTFVIGSNWYGGGAPTLTGSEAGSLLIADALPADPLGHPACGDNGAANLSLVSGSPQATEVAQAFSADLVLRVTDALGGAVSGADIDFAAPGAGASALLGSGTVATDFNGMAATGASANTVAGSYVVTGDLNPPSGAAVGFDLANLPGAVASLLMVSGDGQNGIAGLALSDPLVVQAVDSFGNPVPSTPVGFAVTAGGGSIAGASAVSDAGGIAGSGAWTLGRDAGSNSAQASVSGNPGIAAVTFVASGAEQADIAISKSSTQSTVEPGETVDYLLSVTNGGPSNASAVDVLDALPAELDIATASWVCVASSSSLCSAANGSGNVSLSGNVIPVGGSVSVLLSADVLPDTQNGVFTNTAMAELTSGDDPDALNDVNDRDVEVINATPLDPDIFKDGFEGDPTPFAPDGSGSLIKFTPDWQQVVDLAAPVRLLVMPDTRGKVGVEVIGFRSGDRLWLRMGGRDAAGRHVRSQWAAVSAGELSLAWRTGKAGLRFQLATGGKLIELVVPDLQEPAAIRAAAGSIVH